VAVGEITAGVPEARDRFEPNKFGLNKEDLNEIYAMSPIVSPAMDKVRTWIMKNVDNFFVPVLAEPPPSDL